MKIDYIIDGLKLLREYGLNDYAVYAEHDEILVDNTSEEISQTDLVILHAWGWFQENVLDGEYDKDEGWKAYV